jgi:hypothetical protein
MPTENCPTCRDSSGPNVGLLPFVGANVATRPLREARLPLLLVTASVARPDPLAA